MQQFRTTVVDIWSLFTSAGLFTLKQAGIIVLRTYILHVTLGMFEWLLAKTIQIYYCVRTKTRTFFFCYSKQTIACLIFVTVL